MFCHTPARSLRQPSGSYSSIFPYDFRVTEFCLESVRIISHTNSIAEKFSPATAETKWLTQVKNFWQGSCLIHPIHGFISREFLTKRGRGFSRWVVFIKCAHSGINYYVGRLISMIGRKNEYITHKKQQFLHIRKWGVTIYWQGKT